VTLVATTSPAFSAGNAKAGPARSCCDWLEVRADLAPDSDCIALRNGFKGQLLYSLRSRRAGGWNTACGDARHRRLQRAARTFDLIDFEGEQDLVPELLAGIAPERRVISWYGSVRDEQTLQQLLGKFRRVQARLYRFEIGCSSAEEGIVTLQFLNRARQPDVLAYSTGALGVWTRVLAPRFGAPFVFGGLCDGDERVSGNPSVSELIEDYGFPDLYPVSELFAIAGEPVSGSLSPRLHNAAHRASGTGRLFLSLTTGAFERLWNRLVSNGNLDTMGLTVKGLTVASPHKQSALGVSDKIAPLCRRCHASNLLIRRDGIWKACTTDAEGTFQHAKQTLLFPGARVAVVGCGGSGRVAAAALVQTGAKVTLVNRSSDRGSWAAHLLGLPFIPLKEFSPHGYSAIVNATPLGRDGEELPIDLKDLNPGSLVVDLVYKRSGTTPLVAASETLGYRVVEGRKILLAQTLRQYHLMTGEQMPLGLACGLLGLPSGNPRSRSNPTSEVREFTGKR
jgi:3-dehydroquinate dehydratase/shikimate dehydrogenase